MSPSLPSTLTHTLTLTHTHTPFLLHILLELPASILFFLLPSTQLPTPHPPAHALIRQYAVLLMCSNLIAGVFWIGGGDDDGRGAWVAGALAIYHVAPAVRAFSRIINRAGGGRGGGGSAQGTALDGPEKEGKQGKVLRPMSGRGRGWRGLGGPWVHLLGHGVCCVALARVFAEGIFGREGRQG